MAGICRGSPQPCGHRVRRRVRGAAQRRTAAIGSSESQRRPAPRRARPSTASSASSTGPALPPHIAAMSSGGLAATRVPSRNDPAARVPASGSLIARGQRDREQVRHVGDRGDHPVVVLGGGRHHPGAEAGDQPGQGQPVVEARLLVQAQHPGAAAEQGRIGGGEAGGLLPGHRVPADVTGQAQPPGPRSRRATRSRTGSLTETTSVTRPAKPALGDLVEHLGRRRSAESRRRRGRRRPRRRRSTGRPASGSPSAPGPRRYGPSPGSTGRGRTR